jgi:putative membrane protein
MWDMGPGMGWWMGFGWLWVIGFCLVMMWAVRTLSKGSSGHQDHGPAEAGTPQEILERRYARGELSDEQYEAMRAHLSRSPEQAAV